MSNLWTLIPAAGRSERFRQAGHALPKPLLRVRDRHGRTRRMFDHVLERVRLDNVIVAIPAGHAPCGDSQIMPIEHTRGPCDTISQMLARVPEDARVLLCDCDALVDDENFVEDMLEFIGPYSQVAAVVESDDPNLSRVDRFPNWSCCIEKPTIPCGPGVFGMRAFSRAGQLRLACLDAMQTNPEAYLSAAMTIIGRGRALWTHRYEDWGTPEALRAAEAEIVR